MGLVSGGEDISLPCKKRSERIVVIGLGYVGLPLAVALAQKYRDVTGFDVDSQRIAELRSGLDRARQVPDGFQNCGILFTADPELLSRGTFFILCLPTPLDNSLSPDLSVLMAGASSVGRYITRGAIVVVESTVYPGVTEDLVGPRITEISGLATPHDFGLGYSPERISPSDPVHRLENTVKVVAAQNEVILDRICHVYESIIEAGVYRAASIRVAEAAKVTENVQRDLNIALMNELSMLYYKLGLRTDQVLAAARTKWNFLPFEPGLVGGHCIGVDPYYLTTAAQQVGYHPELILSGRRINNRMAEVVAARTAKLLGESGRSLLGASVGVFGLAFKENCPDIRNSQVMILVRELIEYGMRPLLYDPLIDVDLFRDEYAATLTEPCEMCSLDAVILAVKHDHFIDLGVGYFVDKLARGNGASAVFVDVKGVFSPEMVPAGVRYWAL